MHQAQRKVNYYRMVNNQKLCVIGLARQNDFHLSTESYDS